MENQNDLSKEQWQAIAEAEYLDKFCDNLKCEYCDTTICCAYKEWIDYAKKELGYE